MEKLSREQILDLLARAEAELLRIRISRQPQLLKKPLGLLRKADNACSDVLPRQVYESKCQQFLLTLSQAMEQAIEQDDRSNLKEITELAASILNQLYTNLKDEPALSRLARQKKEIVFLPYKASMWDSLESIWKASVADPEHCHSYVVPIPYADRNPDGTAKEWHNERNLFPSYVPTLDCETFDLEALHPDVIFIHNPYDQCNKVTSVDSRFYSDKLKKYTDKLVYVPYFVLGEPQLDYDDPEKKEENEEAEENIAHFITTPGVLNADMTIVQSEAMRTVYVNVLNRHPNAPEGYWEEHILGLGSPKFDKVAESRKEDFQLPEEWERIIKSRKTILYNTGLTAMLTHTDKFLEKIKSVLETFKAQNEGVLWWRPHPLLKATFESMHPELLGEYDEIVGAYRQDVWGIYDDTSELERAIVCTDGYYGDWSSVVQLYEKTGKPIMVQYIADTKEYQEAVSDV